jgi:hypothetical protein
MIVAILASGIVAKLCWLGVGLWQLRRYRKAALPLYPIPQSIQDARRQTGADAVFCVSSDVTGPATLGHIDPVVLLPASFESLDEDAQRGIACHELLHVRRKDWVVTMLEEVAGALFWFNPAVRWLLANVKLTREQLVDAEVVRMGAPAPYIRALLSMAIVTRGRGVLPAAPFFTEGHLVQRMRSLLTFPRRSWTRLSLSYASAVSIMVAAAWGLVAWVPLHGEAEIVPTPIRTAVLFVHQSNQDNVVFFGRPADLHIGIAPPEGVAGVVGVVGGRLAAPDPAPGDVNRPLFVPPPPPPPPPPSSSGVPATFELRAIQGVRFIRPGEKPSPEELERFIKSFPERSVVEVTQAEDGTIQRITVQARRLRDAANTIPFGDAPNPAGQSPAGTANPVTGAGGVD